MPFNYLIHSLAVLLGLLLPVVVQAQVGIPPESLGPICSVTGLCNTGGGSAPGFAGIVTFFAGVIIPAIRTVFIGVAVLYFAWFALEMILTGYNESTLTEQKKAYSYAAIGMGVVGVSSLLLQTFAPSNVGAGLVDPRPFGIAIDRIAEFIFVATGGFLVFVISVSGFRIIALQGNESEIEKQKKNFFNGLIGIPILFLARIVVLSVVPATGDASLLVTEVGGIIRFLLEIVAALAVIALIASGLLMIVSFHSDNLRQRARRILFSTIVILIVVIFSHALVTTFLPDTTPETPVF